MSGLAGVITAKGRCINDLYNLLGDHEHLGQAIGGIFTRQDKGLYKEIHRIDDVPFLARFGDLLDKLPGNMGIGITSSADVQPLKFDAWIGSFSIVVQGNFQNLQEIGDDLKKTAPTSGRKPGTKNASPGITTRPRSWARSSPRAAILSTGSRRCGSGSTARARSTSS